jgi:hypothetical protein
VPIKRDRDKNGCHWIIPTDDTVKTPGGRTLGGASGITVWWDRDPARKAEEQLIIRQDNGTHADIIIATLGQAYDLIAVLNEAVENA